MSRSHRPSTTCVRISALIRPGRHVLRRLCWLIIPFFLAMLFHHIRQQPQIYLDILDHLARLSTKITKKGMMKTAFAILAVLYARHVRHDLRRYAEIEQRRERTSQEPLVDDVGSGWTAAELEYISYTSSPAATTTPQSRLTHGARHQPTSFEALSWQESPDDSVSNTTPSSPLSPFPAPGCSCSCELWHDESAHSDGDGLEHDEDEYDEDEAVDGGEDVVEEYGVWIDFLEM